MMIELGSDTNQLTIFLFQLGYEYIFTKPLNHQNLQKLQVLMIYKRITHEIDPDHSIIPTNTGFITHLHTVV